MKTPTITITNLILDYIVKYELSIKSISSIPLPYQHKQDLYEKQKADELESLGELIGFPIGYQKAADIQSGKELSSTKSKFKIFNNYRSAQEFIKTYNRAQFLTPSTQLMIHINKIVMSGIIDEWEISKIKSFSEKPNEVYDTWYKHRDYYPDIESIKYFDSIFETILNFNNKTHRLILFSFLLYEMIDKAPFYAGNQLTAILTLSVLMKDFGYNPNNLLPIAKSINFLGADFIESFKISKSKKDHTMFTEALLYSLSVSILDLQNKTENIFNNKVKKNAILSLKLNKRQIRIIEYLQINKKVTRNEYAKLMGVSFMTAFRDLQELFKKDYLEIKGTGRGTFYVLKENIEGENKKEVQVFIDNSE